MKIRSFNLKNLLLPVSVAFLLAIHCSTSSKQKNSAPKKVQQQPLPVMEPQVDSLKKVLDEKRRLRNKN